MTLATRDVHVCDHPEPAWIKGLQGSILDRIFHFLHCWREHRRQMHALSDLDDRLLHDIGVTRPEAEDEMGRLYWETYKQRHLQ